MKKRTPPSTPQKIDLFQLHQADYVAPRKPVLVNIGPAHYLAVNGQGAPGGEVFTARLGALFGVAFTVKMTRKFAGQQDYVVGRLEGQWFFEEGRDPATVPLEQYRWRLLIRTPDFVTPEEIAQAQAKLLEKGKGQEVENVKLEQLEEGQCVQMLHVGPYDREPETIALMAAFAKAQGLQVVGPHHEIYLSDPRRVAPERLKTILRLPVKRA
jgi:hypothetical protein